MNVGGLSKGALVVRLALMLVLLTVFSTVEGAEALPQSPAESVAEVSDAPSVSGESQRLLENSLDGRRLFFTPAERQRAADGVSHDAGSGEAGDAVDESDEAVTVLKGRERPSEPPERKQAGDAGRSRGMEPGIFFNGFVSGPRGLQLLVDGLPCLPLPSSKVESDVEAAVVDCPAVSRPGSPVVLTFTGGRLQVSRRDSVVAVLQPGQGL